MPEQSIKCDCADCPEALRVKLGERRDDKIIIERRIRGKTHTASVSVSLDNKDGPCVKSK